MDLRNAIQKRAAEYVDDDDDDEDLYVSNLSPSDPEAKWLRAAEWFSSGQVPPTAPCEHCGSTAYLANNSDWAGGKSRWLYYRCRKCGETTGVVERREEGRWG